MRLTKVVLCLFAGLLLGVGGSTLRHSTRPVPSAQKHPALYNPTEPPCFEWDLQKAALERFLAETDGPAEAMQAAMRTIEQRYQAATGQSLLQRAENEWPQEYHKLFMMLNYVIAERNAARQSLNDMRKTEGNAALYHGFSNGKTQLVYCQQEMSI
jgi:hypothetical protein